MRSVNENLGTEEGDICGLDGCDGTLEWPAVEHCSCHISPPCHACETNRLECNECGREVDDANDE